MWLLKLSSVRFVSVLVEFSECSFSDGCVIGVMVFLNSWIVLGGVLVGG